MTKQITIKYSYPMADKWVDVLYVEYAGGGEGWEYRASSRHNLTGELTELHTSEDGYGTPEAAVSAGFKWLGENK